MKTINLIDYLKRKQQIDQLTQRVDSMILFYEDRNNQLRRAIKEINEALSAEQNKITIFTNNYQFNKITDYESNRFKIYRRGE